MDGAHRDTAAAEPLSDLTLHDAAALYAVSVRTLSQHLRCGQLEGYKTTGATGREWRVSRDALDAAGYAPRQTSALAEPEPPLVVQLRREAEAARRTAAAQRRRAEEADRRLGEAMMECGRLRAALAAATGEAREDADLDPGTTRWLLSAVRGGPARQRQRT